MSSEKEYTSPYDLYPTRETSIAEGKYIELIPASDVKTVKPRYVDMPSIPLDMVTLISGRAGVGKSTFALHKIALATIGGLDGDYKGKPINVCVFAKEDTQSMQKARLLAVGADMSRVFFGDAFTRTDGENMPADITIPDDIELLEHTLKAYEIQLILVDPLNSYMSGDTNRKDDVRRALDPLARMAQRIHVSVMGIVHFSKGGGYASDKLSGSHAFRDVARSVLLVAKDEETGLCYVTLDKAQYSPEQGKSWRFSLQSVDVRTDEGENMNVARVANLEDSEKSVGEVINLNQARDNEAASNAKSNDVDNDALTFLVDYLTEHDGCALTSEIKKEAVAAGYEWKKLTNARSRSGGQILSRQVKQYVYEWYLTTPIQPVLKTDFTELATELNKTQNSTKNEHVSSVTQPNISNGLEGFEIDRTHRTQNVSPVNETLFSPDVSSVSSVNNSNALEGVEKNSVSSVVSSVETRYKFASEVPYTTLTLLQLKMFEQKGGLWAAKAREEISKRNNK